MSITLRKCRTRRSYEPTKCSRCGVIIKLTTDGYTMTGDEYWCAKRVENVKNWTAKTTPERY